MKNLKFNKKKIASLFLAMGISLTSYKANSEIVSYNYKTTLKSGQEITVYFTTGNTENDYAYVTLGEQVGYLPLKEINMNNMYANNDYNEIHEELTINCDIANVYNMPDVNGLTKISLHKGDKVSVIAKNNNGWYIVSSNNYTGFINEFAFLTQKKMVQITGNNVNIRLTPTTNTSENIIGSANNDDLFTFINHDDKWYVIDYYGYKAYVSDSYSREIEITNKEINNIQDNNKILMAKILGNNVNIRETPDMKDKTNIIGFADQTDYFPIIDKENDWYVIDYLGNYGYIYYKYVSEKEVNKEDLNIQKMVYVTCDTEFYSDRGNNYVTTLPMYQVAGVIKEEKDFYKVRIDGVVGYINKKNTKGLTNTFVEADLGRQIIKVFKNNKEVFRAHMISGRKEMQTDLGVFKIGHKLRNYQLTPEINVAKWIQFHGDEGFHDAYWQQDIYFEEVAKKAYELFALGKATTYPSKYGSHGCGNLKKADVDTIYDIIKIGDNVVVMQPNDLLIYNISSMLDLLRTNANSDNIIKKDLTKVKKLV